MTAVRVSWRDLWLRRSPGLPPGQRRLDAFPRFGDDPRRRPPPEGALPALAVGRVGAVALSLGSDELAEAVTVDRVHDFHCVTTWTRCDLRWSGLSMAHVWSDLIAPAIDRPEDIGFIVACGGDGYRAVLHLDDLLHPDVILATMLDGAPLDRRHGAPLRLVSPPQYGYKSVKHLVALELHETRPASGLGPREHVRARVELEERHSRLPAKLLRLPYRALVPISAALAERSLAQTSSDVSPPVPEGSATSSPA